jgi:hypothetical protein
MFSLLMFMTVLVAMRDLRTFLTVLGSKLPSGYIGSFLRSKPGVSSLGIRSTEGSGAHLVGFGRRGTISATLMTAWLREAATSTSATSTWRCWMIPMIGKGVMMIMMVSTSTLDDK